MDTPKPFGWWIETKEFRWFTREESRVNVWKGMKGVTILALGVIDTSLQPDEVPQTLKPECNHEPDVLKRCIKCGEDLSVMGMTMRGSQSRRS